MYSRSLILIFIMSSFLFSMENQMNYYAQGKNEYKKGNKEKALELFRQSCKKQGGIYCYRIGQEFAYGKGFPESTLHAQEFFNRSCKLRILNACFDEAITYNKLGNEKKSIEILDKMCVKGGFVKSCNALASHYLKKNLAKAKDYLTTACESNYYKSCHSLALIYHEQKDYKKAWVLFNKACEKGAMNEACFAKASRYLNGVGVEKDYFKAELIFTRLCKENVKTSCQVIEDIKNYKVRDTDLYKNAKNKYLNEQLKRNYTVDPKTKLMWQDDKESKIIKLNFKKAKEYCEDLVVGGFNDWRLPTAKEMSTLFNTKNHAFKKFIKNPKNNETYWLFNFNYVETKKGFIFRKFPNNVIGMDHNILLHVRCVRNTIKNKVEK